MFDAIKKKLKSGLNTSTKTVSNGNTTITINGKTHQVAGNNVSIMYDKVIVDGHVIESGLSGITEIKWEGPAANIDCNNIIVTGDVLGNIKTNTIKCGDVGGDVDANTVMCGMIHGDVDANTITRK